MGYPHGHENVSFLNLLLEIDAFAHAMINVLKAFHPYCIFSL